MSHKYKILLIDDNIADLKSLERNIKRLGVNCLTTNGSLKALELVSIERPDMVFTALKMPDKDGITILKEIKKIEPKIIVIILTAYRKISSAIEAMKNGAYDYLQKPLSSIVIKATIQRAIAHKRSTDENIAIRGQIATFDFDNIIGKSEVMKNLFEKVMKIAQGNANVMIYGESGTGKEMLARSIHANSLKKANHFIPVDLVAVPENLLESELFGYEKGAFTGAESIRIGLLEYADQGTLFLDEICELASKLQAKLLRVIQEQEFRRVGGKKLIKVNLRIISATNKEPKMAVKSGLLREDLFYRLNVIPFVLPPLRERKEDIPLLVNYYLEKFGKSTISVIKSIDLAAMDAMMSYSWPGNVRELQNLVEQVVALADGPKILLSDLPEYLKSSETNECAERRQISDLPYYEARNPIMEKFDEEYFENLLKKCDGNISKAARIAQINRKTMYRKLTNSQLQK